MRRFKKKYEIVGCCLSIVLWVTLSYTGISGGSAAKTRWFWRWKEDKSERFFKSFLCKFVSALHPQTWDATQK
ncbi:hypothetical protein D7V94_07170 [Parablautia intestinalis]|uniref:Uncharacterized protein n=1 Tax=Parablautia intestinalis TaxID=2320100 RepID=A0A3A9ALX1_9FIRM|nr:hypothetical protein D7V94_07170 [Parablautia intestinalis]